jgi:invasion protein IalB
MKPFISILAGALAMTAAAGAQTPKPGETFGDWMVNCEAGSPCQAFLGLKDPKTGRLVLSASAHKAVADKNPTLVLTLPLGLSLKDGVALLSGTTTEGTLPARIDVCFPDGCRAVVELTPAALSTLTAQPDFEVRFIVYGAKNRVESVKVSAKGLKEAVTRVSK